jgi:hypothetical protein
MTILKNIHIRFLFFSLAIAVLIWILSLVLPVAIHDKVWNIYLFFLIFSYSIILLNGFLLKALAESFFQIMILAMILRITGSLIFIGVAVWPKTPNILLFIADFFVLFLFYLLFDMFAFISNLRPISK